MKRARSLNSWPGGCLVRESPDTPGSVLPTRALACQYELLHGGKMFAPVAKLWGACASRVLASSPSRTALLGSKLNRGGSESSFLRDAETRAPRRPLPNQLRTRAVAAEWDAPVLSDSAWQ